MPYTNVPKSKEKDMENCVAEVQKRGYAKERAIAICYASIVEGMDLEIAISEAEQAIKRAEENRYTYNGVTVTATQRRSSDRDDKAWMRTVTVDGKDYKVHYADPDMRMRRNNPDARKAFLSRHNCDQKKDPLKPGFWSCYDWTNPDEESVQYSTQETHFVEADISNPKDAGRIWEVTIMGQSDISPLIEVDGKEYILSANGRAYKVEALKNSAENGDWENVKVFDNHLTDKEFTERAGMRSFLGEGVGVLRNARFDDANKCLKARLHVVDKNAREKLLEAYEQGVLNAIGLSIDTLTEEGDSIIYEGKKIPTLASFSHIFSLDVVSDPAAGGRFNRLIAAKKIIGGIEDMNQEELQHLVDAKVAEALAATEGDEREFEMDELKALVEQVVKEVMNDEGRSQEQDEELEPEEAAMVVEDAVEQAVEDAPTDASGTDVAQMAADAAQDAAELVAEEEMPEEGMYKKREEEAESVEAESKELSQVESRIRKLECDLMLDKALNRAKLPAPEQRIVESAFRGRIFTQQELDKVIKRTKEAVAQRDNSGKAKGAGKVRVKRVGLADNDKRALEFLRLVGGSNIFRQIEQRMDNPLVAERVPEFFREYLKWQKPNYGQGWYRVSDWMRSLLGGDPLMDMRAAEAMGSSNLATITKNTVNILLANDYSVKEEWWAPIVQEHEVDTIDPTTLARVYGLSTLSVVEAGDAYTELAWQDEEETASYVKKGNYVEIELETFMLDKLNILQTIPQRLANSWYSTLSALVSNVFTVNSNTGPVLSDTGALFNNTAVTAAGGHANLLTTALGFDAYGAARTAMRKQTDQPLGDGRRLVYNMPKYLLVPVDLETEARTIRNSEHEPDSQNNDVNPYFQEFEILVVPDWTDTNDWALVADPVQNTAIHLIFPRGNRTPQLFTADNDTAGSMFTNDTIRYKVRMMTFRFSSTYDCAPVSDFRPLHKNNVA